jgi:hypothetical protein
MAEEGVVSKLPVPFDREIFRSGANVGLRAALDLDSSEGDSLAFRSPADPCHTGAQPRICQCRASGLLQKASSPQGLSPS